MRFFFGDPSFDSFSAVFSHQSVFFEEREVGPAQERFSSIPTNFTTFTLVKNQRRRTTASLQQKCNKQKKKSNLLWEAPV